MTDFRDQIGIYILYGDLGPHYVGLTRDRSFGLRLKDHTKDKHSDSWDRFSWFGFRRVLEGKDDENLHRLAEMPGAMNGNPDEIIGDIEAVLIRSMALGNVNEMKFAHEGAKKPWIRVKKDEVELYTARLR